jgi:predicted membrane metal-binding protein
MTDFCRYLPMCCLSFLSLFTIVLYVIFFRYLPLWCLSYLTLVTIVLSVIFVAIYHCVACHFFQITTKITDTTMVSKDKNDIQHNGK